MSSNKETTGSLIRFYRKSRGLTQEQLAEAIGAKGSNRISQYESGKRFPDPDVQEAIADALNISVRDLVPDKQNRLKLETVLNEIERIGNVENRGGETLSKEKIQGTVDLLFGLNHVENLQVRAFVEFLRSKKAP